MVTYTLT